MNKMKSKIIIILSAFLLSISAAHAQVKVSQMPTYPGGSSLYDVWTPVVWEGVNYKYHLHNLYVDTARIFDSIPHPGIYESVGAGYTYTLAHSPIQSSVNAMVNGISYPVTFPGGNQVSITAPFTINSNDKVKILYQYYP